MDEFADALAALGQKPSAPPSAAPSSIPPGYLQSTVRQESGGNPNAVSPKGARGVMQVMPETNLAPGYGVTPARDNSEQERTRVGQDYLAAMHDHYKDPALASIAYNMGPGATDKWLAAGGNFHKLPAETRDYVGAIMTGAAVNNRNGGAQQQRQQLAQNQQQQPQQAAQASPMVQDDDFNSAINALSGPAASQYAAPAATPAAAAPAAPAGPQINKVTPATKTSALSSLASVGDTVLNGISGAVKLVDYGNMRAHGIPADQAQKDSNEGLASYLENPISRGINAFEKFRTGTDPKIQDSAAYKTEPLQKMMQFVGDNVGKGADWIAGKTGLAKPDVENLMNAGIIAATPSVGKGIGKVSEAIGKKVDSVGQSMANAKLATAQSASAGDSVPLSSMASAKPLYKLVDGKPVLVPKDAPVAVQPSAEVNPQITAADRSGWNSNAPAGSLSAAATSLDSRFKQSSPEMQAAYAQAKKNGPIDSVAAERHLEADSLNSGVELMPGQASGNIHLISDENNLRAKRPDYADRFNAQNEGLKNKLTSIQDEVAPDVFSTGPTSAGENMISSYGVKDSALKKEISANYQALKDANGGDFPISTKEFLQNADASLKKNLKTAYVPKEIATQLEGFRNGDPMNFEQFEALRTNLANDIRKAQKSGDGNTAYASRIVRDALENVPLSEEAAHLKPLADKARSSAKERFGLLENDPAYKSAIDGLSSADKFIEKYVINGSKKDLITMRKNLEHDPAAQQQIGHAAVDFLKRKGGLVDGNGTLSQAGYNKALTSIREKLGDMVGPEAANALGTVGNVARYTQAQPKGSYVNNSGTFVAGIKDNIGGTAVNVANAAVPFFGLGTTIKNKLAARSEAQSTKKTLQPGAGLVNLRDIGK